MKKYSDKNVSVTWAFDLKKTLTDNFSNEQWADLSNKVVEDIIKPKIDKGLSPVQGERMFQKYKNPKQYPADQKQNNKPNLKLTGQMLYHYNARAGTNPMEIHIGIPKDSGEEVLTKAVANNQGTQSGLVNKISKQTKDRKLKAKVKAASKGIPARPFIPLKGQSFTRDIILEVRKHLATILDKAIKKGLK